MMPDSGVYCPLNRGTAANVLTLIVSNSTTDSDFINCSMSFGMRFFNRDSQKPLNPSVTRSNWISPVTSERSGRNSDAGW